MCDTHGYRRRVRRTPELLEKSTAVACLTIVFMLASALLSYGGLRSDVGHLGESMKDLKSGQDEARQEFAQFRKDFGTEMRALRDEVKLVSGAPDARSSSQRPGRGYHRSLD